MKRQSKILATLLAIAMIATIVPVMALAAADDLDTLTIKGVNVFGMNGFADAGSTTFSEVKTFYLPLTPDQMLSTTTASATVETGGSGSATMQLIAGGNDAAVTNLTEARSVGDALAAQTLAPGDVIWVTDANDKMWRIEIVAASTGTIDGESEVENAIINVVLPLTLDFVLDPLEITEPTAGSQIAPADYYVVNKSNVAVKVAFNITATSGVTFVDRGAAAPASGSDAAKKAFFAVLAANAATSAPTFTNPTGGIYTYNAAAAGGSLLTQFDNTNKAATVEFALGAATPASAPANLATDTGYASFQFFGELNDLAPWGAGDISVSGAYTLQGLRPSTYALMDTVGLNMIDNDALGMFGIKAGAPATLTWTGDRDDLVTNVEEEGYALKIYFAASSKPTTILQVKNFVSNGVWTSGTQYEYDSVEGILTLIAIPPASGTAIKPTIVINTDLGTWLLEYDYD